MKKKSRHYKHKSRKDDDFLMKSGKLLIGGVVVTSLARNLNKVV